MSEPIVIRAYLLEVGDVFEILNVRYRVVGMDDTHIVYCAIKLNYPNRVHFYKNQMGRNSKEKVLLLTKHTIPMTTRRIPTVNKSIYNTKESQYE